MKNLNYGTTATGKSVPLQVDNDGRLIVAPNVSMGAGPTNETTQRVTIAADGTFVDIVGTVAAQPAPTDTAPANIIMLLKRGLQNWTTYLARVPTLGLKTMAESTPVTVASDQTVNVFQPYVAVGSGPTQGVGQPMSQRVTISDDSVLMYSLGYYADAAATSDTGPWNIIQLIKRSLTNWTTYLSRVPALGTALASASSPVAAPKKLTVNGFTPAAISTAYTNLLDSAAGTAALDVTDYQSGDLVIVSTATTGSYIIQAALDSAFTLGVHTLQAQEKTTQTANPINAALTPTNATRVFQLNLQGVNFIRVNLSTGITSGTIRAFVVLNQAIYMPFQINAQQSTAANFAVTASLANNQTLANVTTAGTPAAPATPYFLNSAATTNAALILTGTSGLQAFFATNTGAAAAYVKLYNKATAPTVGTDIPEMVITVPANGQAEVSPGFNGYRFPLGLGIAITGGAADSDTTPVAAGQVKVKLSRTV